MRSSAFVKKSSPFTRVEPGLFENLEAIYRHYSRQAQTYSVVSTEGKTLASCAFLFDDNRAYYWLVGNEPRAGIMGPLRF